MNNDNQPGARHCKTLATTLLAAIALGVTAAAGASGAGQDQEVERLHSILKAYYSDSSPQLPATGAIEEQVAPDTAEREADTLSDSVYSADKVYLSGSEGNALLARFTRRLQDPRIPELHRDVAPICTVKTRLFDTLVDSERLSLKPVGKNHYIASIKLQPGESTFAIKSQQWQVQVPEDSTAREHVVTFYRYPGKKPQLHTFAVEDVVATGPTQAPDWLPPDIAAKFEP